MDEQGMNKEEVGMNKEEVGMSKEEVDKIIEKIDTLDESRIITRESVIGFLVIKRKKDDESSLIDIIPISHGWDGISCIGLYDDDSTIPKKDGIIGILSAPPGTYKVSGIIPDKDLNKECGGEYPDTGLFESLGYEFNGAYSPDWRENLKNIIRDTYIDEENEE